MEVRYANSNSNRLSRIMSLIKLLLNRFCLRSVCGRYAKGGVARNELRVCLRLFCFSVASLSADSTSSSFIFTRQQCFSR